MEQRLSLVTLGSHDVKLAREFYEALGWRTTWTDDDVVFFQAGCMVVALWGRQKVAEDARVEDGGGWGGIALADNTRTGEGVESVLAVAQAPGGTVPPSAGV